MSRSSGVTSKQSVVVLSLFIAAACATQTSEAPLDSFELPTGNGGSSGVGGAVGSGGTEPMGSGGTADGTGGSVATGGTSSGGRGGGAGVGAGGTAAGKVGSAGRGTGGSGATGGTGGRGAGGSAGQAAGGRSMGGRNAAGGSAGALAAGGTSGRGGGGRTGAGGSGTAGSGRGGSAGAPSDCITTLAINTPTPELGKNGACYDITANMMGWNVSNLGTRTLTVNGVVPVDPAPTPPPAVNGHRVFQFGTADGSQNQPTYTTFNYW